ncbi:hypothetical protein LSPH24S_02975 [Lysinibacillus sphaericus]
MKTNYASMIDHTLLKAEVTQRKFFKIRHKGYSYRFASVTKRR